MAWKPNRATTREGGTPTSDAHGTGHRGLTAFAVATLLLGGFAAAHAALTTPACLAKKPKEGGNLRKCQATENGKTLQGKAADPGKCQTKFDENLAKLNAKATAAAIACRYGVNGDATATDYDTGLQWEQKGALDGTPNPADPHDADNTYVWSVSSGPPDGPAFTGFLGTLNNCVDDGTNPPTGVMGGFAGHCDWRLPSIMELEGIVDLSAPGCCPPTFTSPCVDQTVFGPTVASVYWSATTGATSPNLAWFVGFRNGFVFNDVKANGLYVRGVRSGL
jgi:hypothetical protein